MEKPFFLSGIEIYGEFKYKDATLPFVARAIDHGECISLEMLRRHVINTFNSQNMQVLWIKDRNNGTPYDDILNDIF